MTTYYNEIDPYAAQWLRNLIDAGHIAPGVVDERSIEDVRPVDLHGFIQCHFFAGIGVWSLALRRAGWSDNRPIWTASCPCQPFSTAGEGAGFADERHLWPHLHHLIDQRRPPVIVGEQVASKDADPWIDLVQADMEALGYPFGAVAFPSAGIGAPHIRDRTYWVAHARSTGLPQQCGGRIESEGFAEGGSSRGMGHPKRLGAGWDTGASIGAQGWAVLRPVGDDLGSSGATGGMADDASGGRREELEDAGRSAIGGGTQGWPSGRLPSGAAHGLVIDTDTGAGPTNGLWRDADWLFCRDGKWRPVEPGTFPLAHGAAARVGRLRAYGNAVNAEAARVWIETVMDFLPA